MANIKLKRGTSSNITSLVLEAGEPAYTTDTKKLYLGNSDGSKTLINPDAPVLNLGAAAGKNVGTASGEVPILGTDGKLASSVLPHLSLTDTFTVGSQAAMLALSGAEAGDIAVRTDVGKTFILKAAPYSTLSNWQELLTPTSPVQSVAGKTGAVALTKSDVGLGSVDNTADASKSVAKAAALTTARTITLSGDATGSVSFNGSASVTLTVTLASSVLKADSVIDGGTF